MSQSATILPGVGISTNPQECVYDFGTGNTTENDTGWHYSCDKSFHDLNDYIYLSLVVSQLKLIVLLILLVTILLLFYVAYSYC